MHCPDPNCGHLLGQADLAASCCQGCSDILDATQIEDLRKQFGIATYAPPEITIPNKTEDVIPLPEFEHCPGGGPFGMEARYAVPLLPGAKPTTKCNRLNTGIIGQRGIAWPRHALIHIELRAEYWRNILSTHRR
jgi:hypothetical protein